MSKITALDSDTANMNNLPLGYYYYYIPANDLQYGKFLGVCDAIESLTYNPFLTDDNVTYIEATYDKDRYGSITGIAVSDNNGNGYIPPSCKGDV